MPPDPNVLYIGAAATLIAACIGASAAFIGAALGAYLNDRFYKKREAALERAQQRETAATVLGVVWALVVDSDPARTRGHDKEERIQIAHELRGHWKDVRKQVFSFAAAYPDQQVRKDAYVLAGLVGDYIKRNAEELIRERITDENFATKNQVTKEMRSNIEGVWGRIRTRTQLEDMLDDPREPLPYSAPGQRIVDEKRRENRLEAAAQKLKVGDTAQLLRLGLKVTLLGAYQLEEALWFSSRPISVELKDGEVYLVAHVAIENIRTQGFEVRPQSNFQLRDTGKYLDNLDKLALAKILRSSSPKVATVPESDWLQIVGGKGADEWEGEILRGQKREGYLVYKAQKDCEAHLWFDSGPQPIDYSPLLYRSTAHWTLGKVALLPKNVPTLPLVREKRKGVGRAVREATRKDSE